MGTHPINLAVRFLLELSGLVALGYLGWRCGKGAYRYVLALGLPLVAAILWGTFAVLNDSSRSGEALVQVPGIVRLLLELAFFVAATLSLFAIGAGNVGRAYGGIVILHYMVSYDRILWLINQ